MSWEPIIDELRDAMIADGRSPGDTDAILDRVRHVFQVVEKAGAKVDAGLGWALIGLVGERLRRQQMPRRGRA